MNSDSRLPNIGSVAARRLQIATNLVSEWIDKGILPGASLLVSLHGDVIIDRCWGVADTRMGTPTTPDTLWSVASITKPVTANSVLACVDRGHLSLDGQICDLLPEFHGPEDRRPWRQEVTFRHLLTHTSGLAGFSRNNLALRKRHAPIEDFIASFLDEDVHFRPGEFHLYSSVGYGLAAHVVGRILLTTGAFDQSLKPLDIFQQFTLDLLRSLGADDCFFRPSVAEESRIAWVESTGQEGLDWEIGNSPYYRSLGMPWGGLFATTKSVLAFIESFLPRSLERDGVVSRVARSEMTRQHVAVPEPPVTVAATQRDVTWDPMREPRSRVNWGLGWELKGLDPNDYMGDYVHSTAFGHYGASGTIAWADPEEDVAVVLLTNKAWVSRWPVEERRAARLANAIMAAIS